MILLVGEYSSIDALLLLLYDMTTKSAIQQDLKAAMLSLDKKTVNALRLVTAAIKQIEVDERIDVDDARLLAILEKLIKQRKESIQQFQAAERHDLVAQEQFELSVIGKYMPEPLAEAQILKIIDDAMLATQATKISDMGKVMAHIKPQLQGRVDMSQVSSMIKAKLT